MEGSGPPRDFRCGTVAIAGWTNVGKSTLLNRLVGEKVAAVADVPQTTRTRITGVVTRATVGQIVFIDTPGFHQPRHRMNRGMVRTAREALRFVDLVVLVLDAAAGIGRGDRGVAEGLRHRGTKTVVALNKVDRVRPKERLLPMIEEIGEHWGVAEVFPVSALGGEGCEALADHLFASLPVGPALFPDDYLTDQPERVLAAEFIREKLLRMTRQEIPHATAVIVDRWDASEPGLLRIDATILVEKESQKPIVIGKGGQLIKSVGTEARLELESFLGTRIGLKLWVKVRSGWRDDRVSLRELGLA